MSESTPGWGPTPPPGPPYHLPPQPPRGGSLWLGLAIAVGSMALIWFGVAALPGSGGFDIFWLLFDWPFVLLLGGLVLAAIPRTSRTGGGILLGLGAGVLILGGICIALLASV